MSESARFYGSNREHALQAATECFVGDDGVSGSRWGTWFSAIRSMHSDVMAARVGRRHAGVREPQVSKLFSSQRHSNSRSRANSSSFEVLRAISGVTAGYVEHQMPFILFYFIFLKGIRFHRCRNLKLSLESVLLYSKGHNVVCRVPLSFRRAFVTFRISGRSRGSHPSPVTNKSLLSLLPYAVVALTEDFEFVMSNYAGILLNVDATFV